MKSDNIRSTNLGEMNFSKYDNISLLYFMVFKENRICDEATIVSELLSIVGLLLI